MAVVGRGMIGSAAARHLAESGVSTALVGAAAPADYKSADGPFSSHHDEGRITRVTSADPVWAELAARSIERYEDIERRSGIDFHDPRGLVTVTAQSEEAVRLAVAQGAAARMVDVDWVRARTGIQIPQSLADRIAWEEPPAGFVNPRRLVAAETRLAEIAGATVIDHPAAQVSEANSGWTVSGTWGELSADRILFATGAYGAELIGVQLALERRLRTVVLAELAGVHRDGLNIPSLIVNNMRSEHLDGVYWVPPVDFPDGTRCLKIGGGMVPVEVRATSELRAWFNSGGSQLEAAGLTEALRSLLPDATIAHTSMRPCVVTFTASGRPYVGRLSSNAAVAVGGCGAAAKSCDEIGRMAASVVASSDGSTADFGVLDESDFAPIYEAA